MARKRTLREMYVLESDLFEPKPSDERKVFDFHRNSRLNNVNDLERATKFSSGYTSNTVAHDRNNNPSSVYNGSTKPIDKEAGRMGWNDPAAHYDFGRAAPVNRQGRPGLKGTSLPVVTVAESLGLDMEDIDDLSEEELGGLVLLTETLQRRHFQAAADYVRKSIDDPEERQRTADHFANFFAQSNNRFDHNKWHRAAGTKTQQERVVRKY